MEYKNTKAKNRRGSITLFILFSGLFFIMFLSTALMYGSIKGQAETEATKQAQEIYSSTSDEETYQSYFGQGEIPIYTAEQLAKIGSDEYVAINQIGGTRYKFTSSASYVLMGDIQLNGSEENRNWVPIGNEANPFMGTFEGNGYAIYDLYNEDTTGENQGFFGCCENANIRNLIIASGSIQAASLSGAIVGTGKNTAIHGCSNQSDIECSTNIAGGIAGTLSENSNIKNCKNSGAITCTAGAAGGIIGNIADDTVIVEQSTNTGEVTANTEGTI